MTAGSRERLGEQALNRALLARQGLLARCTGAVPEVLERTAGLQAQYAPSCYVGLWSRLEGFRRADLDRALERREVVQGTLQRVTIHLVSRQDYWPLALATRTARRAWWLRDRPGQERAVRAAAEHVRAHLEAAGRATRAELQALVGRDLLGGVGLWVDLVRVPPSGTWEHRRADHYALAEAWLGPPTTSEQDALPHVVRRYLAAFGPAPARDVADWAGFPVRQVDDVADGLGLRQFRDEHDRVLLDVPDGILPDPGTPAPVRFLPTFDATLLVHARRSGVLPEPYRPLVFDVRRPPSVPTLLVDGRVAGTWRHEQGEVVVTPFAPLPRAVQAEVDAEGRRLAQLHAEPAR